MDYIHKRLVIKQNLDLADLQVLVVSNSSHYVNVTYAYVFKGTELGIPFWAYENIYYSYHIKHWIFMVIFYINKRFNQWQKIKSLLHSTVKNIHFNYFLTQLHSINVFVQFFLDKKKNSVKVVPYFFLKKIWEDEFLQL